MTPINIDFVALNIPSLLPIFITLFAALLLMVLDLIKPIGKLANTLISMSATIASLYVVMNVSVGQKGYFDLLTIDSITVLSQIIILLASTIFIPLSLTSKRFHEFELPEFYSLFLFVVSGFQIMVSTTNFALIFLGLETSSLALYTLISMHNRDRSVEGAIKYFTMGSLAAGFLAFGIALFYLATGSLDIAVGLANLESGSTHLTYGI